MKEQIPLNSFMVQWKDTTEPQYDYSYSCGMNAMYISPVLQPRTLLFKTVNSENFGGTASKFLNVVPECNSMVRFSSGSYVPVSVNTAPPVNDEINSIISNSILCKSMYRNVRNIYSTIYATPSGQTSCSSTLADDDVLVFIHSYNSNTTIKVIGSFGFDPRDTIIYCRDNHYSVVLI